MSCWKRSILFFGAGFIINVIVAAGLSLFVSTGDGRVGVPLVQGSPWTLLFQQHIQPYKRTVMAYAIRHADYLVVDDVEIGNTDHRLRFGWDAKYIGGGILQPEGRRNHSFSYEERRVGLPLRSARGKLLEIDSGTTADSHIMTEGLIPMSWSLYYPTIGGIVWRPTLGAIPNSLFYAMILWLIVYGRSGVVVAIRRRGGRCTACGYDLSNISSTHCPECGSDQSFRLCT